MFRLPVSVLLVLLVQTLAAQQPVLQWARVFTANNSSNYRDDSNGRTVGVDQQGNVYSAGLFEHTIDFDPGPGVYNLTGGAQDQYGIYISKLDANGNFIWAKQIPALVEFGAIELKVDKAGNIYLASDLSAPADMDPGPGVLMMTPIGAKDAFVVKLDTDGNLVWAKQFGGPGDTVPQATGLDIDKDNNVVVSGSFNNTVDFDPGPGVYKLTSTAHIQAYIVKLNSQGNFTWAIQFGNAPIVYSGSQIIDIKCDAAGNIYTTGGFAGNCDFDPGAGQFNMASSSLRDGFIAKLDPNAGFVWAKRIGNSTNDYYQYIDARSIDIDGMNNVITTGDFTGTIDFNPGTAVYSVASNAGTSDAYILKLNSNGDFVWAKAIGGNQSDTGNDLVLDADNNIYAVGSYGPSVDFDPGPGDYTINTPNYGAAALVKLSADGNFVYAAAFPSIYDGNSLFRRMAIDDARNIYVSGDVSGVVDFDPGPAVYPLAGSSDESPFVLKLGRCMNATASSLFINECNSYTLNKKTFDSSGVYIQTIPNGSGCDSVITLYLTINKKQSEQTIAICQGAFFYAGGTNQQEAGIYRDTLHTRLGCDSVVTTHLTVNPVAMPDLGPDKNICSNAPLHITPGLFASYLWQDGSQAASFEVHTPGVYWVKVSNQFNCPATDTFIVKSLVPAPTDFLPVTDSVCGYNSVDLAPLQAYSSYQWSTGALQKSLQVKQPGLYWLTVTDANGCTGTDSITVITKQCSTGVYFPTAFTPDGNGKNDLFRPLLFGNLQQYRFAIYNRWGTAVFQSTDPQKGWDGKWSGSAQPAGVFVWTCFYQLAGEAPKMEKGTVVLIR